MYCLLCCLLYRLLGLNVCVGWFVVLFGLVDYVYLLFGFVYGCFYLVVFVCVFLCNCLLF